MHIAEQFLADKLSNRKQLGNLRQLRTVDHSVDFSSNDYLGLARSTELNKIIQGNYELIQPKRNGSGGSRLLSGNTSFSEELEEYLAHLFQSEASLLFNSGYAANTALLSTIPQKGDTILYDELSHASAKDGIRLSFANRYAFRHNNLNDLEHKLKKAIGRIYIFVESVYSMDGDIAPLEQIIQLSQKYNSALIVDEAHSTGIYGKNGNGLCCEKELEQQVFARIHTFGKAMGIHGACVVGSKVLKDFLINFSRPFIYTTAMNNHSLLAIHSAFNFLEKNHHLKKELQKKVSYFNLLLSDTFGEDELYHHIPSKSPIQALIIQGNEKVKNVSNVLQEKGLDVRPILSPTVKKGQERLRICLHTFNSEKEIQKLFLEMKSAVQAIQ
ncbi:aminotransferase class I/II-fold pyridoxal phosphate-dependent enzyme [Xanthovirga aplysinae]|uniref:aminotransferase class I/II-fold pyridoxal phosphate-dependent enzyme n=1 Tax=Xanthovirga aplysinae TaxID=2529853 RepID=UPI0012BCDD46|nr:8-amino-7-oxononanoate synthase [Xanthovirga aplysinae]MTI31014.1 8-amino-7-oxononanoate synthase [Xanthovirga aplysinae]